MDLDFLGNIIAHFGIDMNERIKELEKQATTVVEGWSDENGTTRHYEFNHEKFAELIVSDCLDIVDENVSGMVGVNAMKKIEEHFGMRIE